MGKDQQFDHRVMEWVNAIRGKIQQGSHPPGEFMVLDHLLHEMRLIKSPEEVKLMTIAAQISARGHKRAMLITKPGLREYQLEAELLYEFTRSGCKSAAYNSIVAAGPNACILHYDRNDDELRDGDLVLIDAGCEFNYYASDITRTFPVNGRFSEEQQALYEIVLAAQQEAIKVIKPGVPWDQPHKISVEVITRGLVSLGLLEGNPQELIKAEAYREFYMHKVGHWIGLDVHDVGDYKIEDKWRLMEEGMVTTVEPGIYVSPENDKVEEKWRGIGIRIEDDVLVTKKGHKVLSADIPKTVREIEALMSQPVPAQELRA